MRMSLFKSSKPKGFEFKPRYYDPEKEEFEQRVASIKAEIARENGNLSYQFYDREAVKSRIRNNWNTVSQREAEGKTSNMRILLIAGVLALGAYLFFFTDYFSA